MKKITVACFLFCFILFLSCNKEQKKTSLHYLQRVDSLLILNNTELAKRTLDSIHILFPSEIEIRKKAVYKKYEIDLVELERNYIFYDSVSTSKRGVVDTLKHYFVLKEDSFYRGEKVYEHLLQAKMLPKTSIKVDVNEQGIVSLSSIYTGLSPIEHSSMKVESGDVFIQTSQPETNSKAMYAFRDGADYWEIRNYTEKDAREVLLFVEQFEQEIIKVRLLGEKNHIFQLDQNDKKRIIATWHYSLLLKEIDFAYKQKNIIQSKIASLRNKVNTR
jgi:hypothetical protein